MKKFIIVYLLLINVLVFGVNTVYAYDLEAGAEIFSANCSTCHAGGNNLVVPAKTLEKEVLEENGMHSMSAITTQVKNGKNAMPAFGGKLADEEIDNVANYVLKQSDMGWE